MRIPLRSMKPVVTECALCGIPAEILDDTDLHRDHNHYNGRVRGWLCRTCNTRLMAGVDAALFFMEFDQLVSRLRDYINAKTEFETEEPAYAPGNRREYPQSAKLGYAKWLLANRAGSSAQAHTMWRRTVWERHLRKLPKDLHEEARKALDLKLWLNHHRARNAVAERHLGTRVDANELESVWEKAWDKDMRKKRRVLDNSTFASLHRWCSADMLREKCKE